jgi:hypothetical protein
LDATVLCANHIIESATQPAPATVAALHDSASFLHHIKDLSHQVATLGAYDHELLAIYYAVKHFCHMLEVHHFIFTDHKPVT